jgi:hypothetical protein
MPATERIQIQVTKATRDKLRQLADREHRSISNYLEVLTDKLEAEQLAK